MQILIFLGVLSVLVLVHELGHFFAAKKNGIKVDEFGFGYPPRVLSVKYGETIYSINLFPIGGFVRLYGEDEPKLVMPGRTFYKQKKRVRLLVLTAGVIMNFLLGVVLFGIIYTVMGIPSVTDRVRIVGLADNSPAVEAGVELEEVVFAVDGEAITTVDQFVDIVSEKSGEEVELSLTNKDVDSYGRVVTLVPRENPPDGEGALGVVVSSTERVHYSMVTMPFRGMWFGLKEAVGWGVMIAVGLFAMFRDLFFSGVVPNDVAGPLGIYQMTGEVAQNGFLSMLQFVGVLSINLAILNILPLPALDGGRLVFLIIEAIRGKRVGERFERSVHAGGMILLLGLMVIITLNDVVRASGAENFWDLVRRIL